MGNTQNRFLPFDRVLPKCEPGDLLEILYPNSSFNHWAVYIGEGAIIHVRQPWIKRESVESAVGADFNDNTTRSKLMRINNDKHKVLKIPPQSSQKIIDSANEQIGVEWYNMQLYGCEMFAIRCRYGVKVDVRNDFYKSTDIEKPTDSMVALSNPLITHGHQQHEF